MKILSLHGLNLTVGGIKPTYLKHHGHTVLNPALNAPVAVRPYTNMMEPELDT
jgi:hypothetical protein